MYTKTRLKVRNPSKLTFSSPALLDGARSGGAKRNGSTFQSPASAL